jgi:hypothetical protein
MMFKHPKLITAGAIMTVIVSAWLVKEWIKSKKKGFDAFQTDIDETIDEMERQLEQMGSS